MENKSLDTFIKQSLENFEVDIPQDWAFMEDMLDADESTPVDKTAKTQLQEMEVPFDASTWLAMEAALDDLDVNDVDEAAKSALGDFQVKYSPADWAIMGAALDAEIPDEIDDLAKSALENYAVPFTAMDWEMMDEALDNAGFPNEIDEAAKAALRQFETAMPSDWAAMESVLMEAEQIRRQLIITKSIELFLFIFAIWTIGNFLPFKQKSSDSIIYPIENVTTNKNNKNLENITAEETQPQANENPIPAIHNLSIFSPSSENSFDNQSSGNIENVKPSITPNSNSSFELNLPIINIDKINTVPPMESNGKTTIATADKPIATLETKETDQVLVTYPNKKGRAFNTNNSTNNSTENSVTEAVISTENANFLDKKSFNINKNAKENLLGNYTLAEASFYRLRMKAFVSPQYATFTNNNASYSRQKTASGISAGLGIDYALSNKFEISSGITYNHKSYVAREQAVFANSYNQFTLSSIQDVKLGIIQVPIRVNYNIKKDDRIRLYGVTGITAGMIMKVVKSTQAASLANGIFNLRDGKITADAMSAAEAAGANSGVLQSGSMNTSSFMTVDIGLGLEYQTGGRYSFFIEPIFQHSITKIGIDQESYQNYGLSLGSRIIL
jgi:hypothetical protein